MCFTNAWTWGHGLYPPPPSPPPNRPPGPLPPIGPPSPPPPLPPRGPLANSSWRGKSLSKPQGSAPSGWGQAHGCSKFLPPIAQVFCQVEGPNNVNLAPFAFATKVHVLDPSMLNSAHRQVIQKALKKLDVLTLTPEAVIDHYIAPETAPKPEAALPPAQPLSQEGISQLKYSPDHRRPPPLPRPGARRVRGTGRGVVPPAWSAVIPIPPPGHPPVPS